MNSSQLLMRRSELEFFTPTPITVFAFSRSLEFLVAIPVAIGLFHHDRALREQSLEHLLHVELGVARLSHAERDVLEIAENREATRLWGARHRRRPAPALACGFLAASR